MVGKGNSRSDIRSDVDSEESGNPRLFDDENQEKIPSATRRNLFAPTLLVL
jgi:hypothetical protein